MTLLRLGANGFERRFIESLTLHVLGHRRERGRAVLRRRGRRRLGHRAVELDLKLAVEILHILRQRTLRDLGRGLHHRRLHNIVRLRRRRRRLSRRSRRALLRLGHGEALRQRRRATRSLHRRRIRHFRLNHPLNTSEDRKRNHARRTNATNRRPFNAFIALWRLDARRAIQSARRRRLAPSHTALPSLSHASKHASQCQYTPRTTTSRPRHARIPRTRHSGAFASSLHRLARSRQSG